MATKISIDDRFDCAPQVLFDRLSDDGFDDGLMKALNMSKELLDAKTTASGVTYKIRLTNPDTIPAIAKRFAGEHLSYVETRAWDRAKLGNTWEIVPEIQGATVEAKGTTEIVADGVGCIRRTRGTISVNLPLIGRKIEEMVLQSIVDTFKRNAEYCRNAVCKAE